DFFHIQLTDDKQGRRYLELTYAGGVLRDEWVLADAGVTLCSTIKCIVKEEEKPTLYVFNAVTQEKVPIMGKVHLLNERVSQLKSLVSMKCGFPVSVFCLRTLEGKEMYDCNTLSDYKLEIGGVLRLDVWDGWKELLEACVLGHKQNVQRYLSKNETILRYQQRVALYIAAHFGHLKMAAWLQKKGVRADEAIGVHPYREWCCETDHADIGKCAIHAAAEAGQLLLIKAFVARNVCVFRMSDSFWPNTSQDMYPPGTQRLRIIFNHEDVVSCLFHKYFPIYENLCQGQKVAFCDSEKNMQSKEVGSTI
ncbi:unnamed protein product, partial [Staurois parvus]